MKIKEILSEDRNDFYSKAKEQEFIEFITKNCQPWLSKIGGLEGLKYHRVYRGVRTPSDMTYDVMPVNQNRPPIDTPADTQNQIDHWFQIQSGIRYRQSSIFVTSNYDNATKYTKQGAGTVLTVIPVGDFHFCWSSVYRDMTQSFEDFFKLGRYATPLTKDSHTFSNGGFMFPKNKLADPDVIINFMKDGHYEFDHHLLAAMQSGHEIMLNCKEVIVARPDWLNRFIEML